MIIAKIRNKLEYLFREYYPLRVLDFYSNTKIKPKGHVLVSYLSIPITWQSDDKRFLGHTNAWESTEIVKIFNRLGYVVDVVSWDDHTFVTRKDYKAVFDIHSNLERYATKSAVKFFHVTGSNPEFSNKAEIKRLEALKCRRGVELKPRRAISAESVNIFEKNMRVANITTLIGNEVTASTFPDDSQIKINLVIATGSYLTNIRDIDQFKMKKEFLWFNGVGAVHKGLDLILEIFARNQEYTLHVVGPYLKEKDFVRAYKYELTKCPNIISHGFLHPSSSEFQRITQNVIAFISPSCSEGISTASITCMQYGLIPIVSTNSGISLNENTGYILKYCSQEEIENALHNISGKHASEIKVMSLKIQNHALKYYSREAFSERMTSVLASAMRMRD